MDLWITWRANDFAMHLDRGRLALWRAIFNVSSSTLFYYPFLILCVPYVRDSCDWSLLPPSDGLHAPSLCSYLLLLSLLDFAGTISDRMIHDIGLLLWWGYFEVLRQSLSEVHYAVSEGVLQQEALILVHLRYTAFRNLYFKSTTAFLKLDLMDYWPMRDLLTAFDLVGMATWQVVYICTKSNAS